MRLLSALVISDDLQPEHTEPTWRAVDAVVRPIAGRAQRSYYDLGAGVAGVAGVPLVTPLTSVANRRGAVIPIPSAYRWSAR